MCDPDPLWEITTSRKNSNEVTQTVRRRDEVVQPVAVAAYQPQQTEQVAIELDTTAAPQTIQAAQPVPQQRQRAITKAPHQKQRSIVKPPAIQIDWVKGLTVIASTVGKVAGWSLKTTWLVTKATVTIAGKITLPLLKVTGSQSVRAGQSFKQAIANDLNRYQSEMAMRSVQPTSQPAQPIQQPAPVTAPLDLSNIGQLKRTAEPVQIPVQPRQPQPQKRWT